MQSTSGRHRVSQLLHECDARLLMLVSRPAHSCQGRNPGCNSSVPAQARGPTCLVGAGKLPKS